MGSPNQGIIVLIRPDALTTYPDLFVQRCAYLQSGTVPFQLTIDRAPIRKHRAQAQPITLGDNLVGEVWHAYGEADMGVA